MFVFLFGEFNQSINNVDIPTKPYDGRSIARGKFPIIIQTSQQPTFKAIYHVHKLIGKKLAKFTDDKDKYI